MLFTSTGRLIKLLIIFQVLNTQVSSLKKQRRSECKENECSQNKKNRAIRINDKKLEIAEGYDLNDRPFINEDLPTHVKAAINIRNIMEVDEKSQIVSLDITLRLFWMDKRIVPKGDHFDGEDYLGKYASLNPVIAEQIWMPDIFIDQAKDIRAPKYFIEPASVRIYQNSMIRYSSRLNFDVACNMDFHLYPVDIQICFVKFESFDLQTSQIGKMLLSWLEEPYGLVVNPDIKLAQFNSSVSLVRKMISGDPNDDEYPGIMIKLKLKRSLGYHIVQTYIPSSLFVVLAWLSLFIPAESVPGRVGMVMTTMLTLTAMFASVRQNVPKISYCSVLDIWMLISIIFVFCTMLEFIIVTTFKRKKMQKTARKFERFCIICFPVTFIMTNFLYWILVLIIRALSDPDYNE